MDVKTDELFSLVDSLPIDTKMEFIERIIDSLHPAIKEIDELWVIEAEKRLNDIKNGKVKAISSAKIFEEILKKYR